MVRLSSPSRGRRISKPVLTLYGRPYCHLCDDMFAALEALRGELGFSVEVLDIDGCPADLLARHDERVPVLMFGDEEICHYFLDAAKVREVLGRFR